MAGALKRAILEGDNDAAIERLSHVEYVNPDVLSIAIEHNPKLIPYIAPKTTVTSEHMFDADRLGYSPLLLKILAADLTGYEALETFMLATEGGHKLLAKIVRESRSPNFLEEAILAAPESAGVFGYIKSLGFQPGLLYATVVGNLPEVKRLLNPNMLDTVLNLALLYEHPEIVELVMSSDYDKITMLRKAIENENNLATYNLIDYHDELPEWIIDLLIYHEYDIEKALEKVEPKLQRSAEIAAMDGNIGALRDLFLSKKAVPSELMLAIAVANGDEELQQFISRYVSKDKLADKFNKLVQSSDA